MASEGDLIISAFKKFGIPSWRLADHLMVFAERIGSWTVVVVTYQLYKCSCSKTLCSQLYASTIWRSTVSSHFASTMLGYIKENHINSAFRHRKETDSAPWARGDESGVIAPQRALNCGEFLHENATVLNYFKLIWRALSAVREREYETQLILRRGERRNGFFHRAPSIIAHSHVCSLESSNFSFANVKLLAYHTVSLNILVGLHVNWTSRPIGD